jgi:hypothetical protein
VEPDHVWAAISSSVTIAILFEFLREQELYFRNFLCRTSANKLLRGVYRVWGEVLVKLNLTGGAHLIGLGTVTTVPNHTPIQPCACCESFSCLHSLKLASDGGEHPAIDTYVG